MGKPFKGKISVDIRDSVPDWAPFEPPKAPDGAPNVVYIVLDDVGFSAMCCYGGPIETPNIDRIAADGVRYTQWHTTALCSPTRSCLLTGRNHTRNSMACITEARGRVPERQRHDPAGERHALGDPGRAGLEHLHGRQVAPVPDGRDERRLDRGGTGRPGAGSSAATGSWAPRPTSGIPDLVYDNHPVDQPKSPEEGYHLTEDLTDKALEFIKDAKTIAPDKPFFLYYAPGAAHAPHHVPEGVDRQVQGQVRHGLRGDPRADPGPAEADGHRPGRHRAAAGQPDRHARRPAQGPDGQPFPPLDVTRPWDSLSADEKRLFCRMAEVYAGFLAHADHHIGRLLDYLEESGQRDNTLVILVSDNGASGEGGPNGSVNENKFANGIPDDMPRTSP